MKCNQVGCTEEAAYTLVWAEHKFYCPEHAMEAVSVSLAMGFPTPATTVRVLTLDEILADEQANNEARDEQ